MANDGRSQSTNPLADELTNEIVWKAMGEIMDPEIPVISLVEMGIIRDVNLVDGHASVTMTPTFSGCPALLEMETLIEEKVGVMGKYFLMTHDFFSQRKKEFLRH